MRGAGHSQGLFRPKFPEKYRGNPNNIVFRSSWEKRFFKYCDETPGILKWASEEFFIPYIKPTDGNWHRYFPDVFIEVRTADGSVKPFLIEIKPKAQAAPPKLRKRRTQRFLAEMSTFAVNQAKWAAAQEFCAKRGWTFLVLTEDHLFGRTHARS